MSKGVTETSETACEAFEASGSPHGHKDRTDCQESTDDAGSGYQRHDSPPESEKQGVDAEWAKEHIRENAVTAHLFGVCQRTVMADLPIEAYREYIKEFVIDVVGEGLKDDRLICTCVEQMLLMQHTVNRLMNEALDSSDVDRRKANLQLATNLQAEHRRQTKDVEAMLAARRRQLSIFSPNKSGERKAS